MNIKFYKSQLTRLVEQRNGYMLLAGGLIVLCILLVLLIFNLVGRERTIIAPPVVNKTFWVTNSEVSEEYLTEMSVFFAYMRLNVTPANVQYQHEVLLRFADPSFYGELEGQLELERKYLLNEHLNKAYYPSNLAVDIKNLKVRVIGTIHPSVGTEKFKEQNVVYEIKYGYKHGRLLIKAFGVVNHEDT